MEDVDIHLDSGRYLQEYVASLENLPSEIAYHWAEIQNRNNQCQALERRIQLQQQDLTKIHRQWFQPDADKKEKLLRQEPSIIRRIQRDYEKLSELSTERIQLAEEALRLLDRHLHRLAHDLDELDKTHPDLAPATNVSPAAVLQRKHGELMSDVEGLTEDDHVDEEDEEEYYHAMMAQRHKKRKKKEARDNDDKNEEPVYCFCRQVSYGEMVACDGEHCPFEWFHMECVGLDAPPKGAWYCDECAAEVQSKRKEIKKMKRKKESMMLS